MTGTHHPPPTVPSHRRVHLDDDHEFLNWQVVSHLADGGTSSVYRVRYIGLRVNEYPAEAALKITPIPSPEVERWLIDEYEKARAVAHEPNVVRALDAFPATTPDAGRCVVLIHELGDESLSDHLRRVGPLQGAGLARLQDDLIAGLAALHGAGMIHSDVKPANILRFDTVWKLADLETAASMGPQTWAPLIGATPHYAPPELLRALRSGQAPPPVRPHADLWSLGIVLHEAATGRRPFADEASQLQGTPNIDPAIPAGTRDVIARCLVPESQRLRNAIELEQLVASGRAAPKPGVVTTGRASPKPSVVATASRSPRWPYAVVAVFGCVALGLASLPLLDRSNGPAAGGSGAADGSAVAAPLAGPACADGGDGLALRFVDSQLLGDNNRARAAQIAVDEVNAVNAQSGRPPIDYQVTTTANEPTPDELADLLGSCPDALVTNLGSQVSLDIMSQVTGAGVIELSVNATSPLLDGADTVGLDFGTAPSDAIQGRLLAREIRQAGSTKAAVVYLDDAYGAALKDEFEQNFEGGEAKPRVIAEYGFGLQDQIDRARLAELVSAGPDAIVLIAFDEQSAEAARILDEQGYDFGSVWLVDGNARIADHLGDQRAMLDGAHQVTVGAEGTGPALSALRSKLAIPPGERLESYAAQSYDAVVILALAAAAADATEPSALAAEIAGITTAGQTCLTYADCLQLLESGQNIDYDGVGGPYELTDDGRPFEALYYLDTLGPDGRAALQRSELRAETLCEICEANDESLRISFQPNSAEVGPEFATALQTIAEIVNSSRAENVLIEGYASPDGAPEANCKLSEARARAVHDILVTQYGVRDDRLTPVGLCATDLFIENRTVLFTEPE